MVRSLRGMRNAATFANEMPSAISLNTQLRRVNLEAHSTITSMQRTPKTGQSVQSYSIWMDITMMRQRQIITLITITAHVAASASLRESVDALVAHIREAQAVGKRVVQLASV